MTNILIQRPDVGSRNMPNTVIEECIWTENLRENESTSPVPMNVAREVLICRVFMNGDQ